MKLRTVNRIINNTTGHSEKDVLEYANCYGYTLPKGGTPWDAETMTIRLIGLGKHVGDVLAGFDPEQTFEVPGSPAPRLPFVAHWHYPTLPGETGQRVTFATITANSGRGGVIEIVCTGPAEYQVVADGTTQVGTWRNDPLRLKEAAERAGMVLGRRLCGETV